MERERDKSQQAHAVGRKYSEESNYQLYILAVPLTTLRNYLSSLLPHL